MGNVAKATSVKNRNLFMAITNYINYSRQIKKAENINIHCVNEKSHLTQNILWTENYAWLQFDCLSIELISLS